MVLRLRIVLYIVGWWSNRKISLFDDTSFKRLIKLRHWIKLVKRVSKVVNIMIKGLSEITIFKIIEKKCKNKFWKMKSIFVGFWSLAELFESKTSISHFFKLSVFSSFHFLSLPILAEPVICHVCILNSLNIVLDLKRMFLITK